MFIEGIYPTSQDNKKRRGKVVDGVDKISYYYITLKLKKVTAMQYIPHLLQLLDSSDRYFMMEEPKKAFVFQ